MTTIEYSTETHILFINGVDIGNLDLLDGTRYEVNSKLFDLINAIDNNIVV